MESCVKKDGVEKTLLRLQESGVYLTYDEFKGRKEVSRGGKTFRFDPNDFNNPLALSHISLRTGGTTGPSVKMAVGL